MKPLTKKIPVAVLAATGSVGQRFVQLLDGHPWFEVAALTASPRRVGQRYREACHWVLESPMPVWAREMRLLPSSPEAVEVPLVFSALPSDQAAEVEPEFARAGAVVCTNAGAFRRDPYVPILLPEINPDHLELIEPQRTQHGWRGLIVTNPNCTSTGTAIVLNALHQAFGVRKVFMVSMQAVSGAGYPGVASMDILGNVVPFIGGEEEKVEWEARKILGTVKAGKLELAGFTISAHTNRVAVQDGHLVCMSVELENPPRDLSAAVSALEDYHAPEISRCLPSTPDPVILLRPEADRPQPRLDRLTGGGMTTVVGRVRPDPLFHLKLVVLSHNTIRGAAGGSVFNAELLVETGLA